MKCNVCERRMNSGRDGFFCTGCGHTSDYEPVSKVIEKMESDVDDPGHVFTKVLPVKKKTSKKKTSKKKVNKS